MTTSTQAPTAPRASVDTPSNATELVISTAELRKTYGRRAAVEPLTMNVRRGEVFGFLGPNGAGKSTVVKMLTGLVRPSGGTALMLGQPIGHAEARRRVGYLPELFRFHDWLTGYEFLDLHGKLSGMTAGERRKRIPEVLELVGLAGREHERVRGYSKGMQQRVGLGQAIIHNPEVVFLDEPTSALDPLGRRDVRDIIRFLRSQGTTVFLNSHLLSEVESVCDRVAIMNRGQLVALGALSELLGGELVVDLVVTGSDELISASLARIAPVRRFESLSDGRSALSIAVADDAAVACAVDALVASGVAIYSVTPRKPDLEDLFIRLVAEREP
jgi:ABC-2 type transport system ATP-binding protein